MFAFVGSMILLVADSFLLELILYVLEFEGVEVTVLNLITLMDPFRITFVLILMVILMIVALCWLAEGNVGSAEEESRKLIRDFGEL